MARRLQLIVVLAVALVAAALTYWRVSAPTGRILVGIASAFAAESEPIFAALTDAETDITDGVSYRRGVLGGTDVVLFDTGSGMINAASRVQHAIDHFPLTHLIFTGIAGSIDPQLAPGTVVVPEVWINHQHGMVTADGGAPMPMDLPPPVLSAVAEAGGFPVDSELFAIAQTIEGVAVGGVGVSGDVFVVSETKRDELREDFGARIVDMESAAAAQVALLNGVPFIAVRAVSDSAGEAANDEILSNLRVATNAAAAVVMEIVGRIP